ncbi:MAG TPA: ABC transporter permease, partial [Blastocatellia bacterium]|nr:ABC transporter permease [Blastocatellia bacterium]
HLWLIQFIGLIVPRRLRADWRQEWEAELRHRETLLAEWDKLNWRNKLDLLRRSLGAFWDALLLQPQRMEDEMFQDLRYGIRMLFKHKAFTAVAVFTLALGIGATTAIFSVVNAVLLNPLAYPEAERIMLLSSAKLSEPGSSFAISYPNFLDWQKQQTTFTHLAAARTRGFNLTGAAEPVPVNGAMISPEAFPLLGVAPQIGRVFTEQDNQLNSARTVVLSHAFWQRQFAGEANVIGRQLLLDDQSYTVIGVMPPRFKFWTGEIWVPFGLFANEKFFTSRTPMSLIFALGRLKPGATLEQARTEFAVIAARLAAQYPEANKGQGVSIVSYGNSVGQPIRPALLILFGAVGFVLLIACANVAGLLPARTATRKKELAIRAALGAGRGRLVRQLLLESLLLSALGSLFGWLPASWGLNLIPALLPDDLLPAEANIRLDAHVLMFALGLTLLTTLLCGLLPALRFSKQSVSESLQEGGSHSTAGVGNRRMRGALVVMEVALSVVLLVGAGLLIKSFARLQQAELGFRKESLLTAHLVLPLKKYPQAEQLETFFSRLLEQAQGLPGIEAAATMNAGPFANYGVGMPLIREGQSLRHTEGMPNRDCGYVLTQGDYLTALGLPLVSGRSFTSRDTSGAPLVAMLNQAAADKFFPGENPLGQRILLGEPDDLTAPGKQPIAWLTVVGIVKNHQHFDPAHPFVPAAFIPRAQAPHQPYLLNVATLLVRTTQDPTALISLVRQRIHELDPDQPIPSIVTMDARVAESLKPQRFNTLLMSLFAALALVLALIGLYGVLAYHVVQRTHEIGIRLALGAQPNHIVALVMTQGLRLVLFGLALGLAGAYALTRLLNRLLYGISAADAPTFAVITFLLLLVTLPACWLPARRATRVDPLAAMKHE